MNNCIGANKFQLYGKIAWLLLLGTFLLLPIYLMFLANSFNQFIPLTLIILLVLMCCLILFLDLSTLPIGVFINKEQNVLIIKYLVIPHVVVPLADITYSITNISTKLTSYDGILLCTNDGKKHVLSKFNLKAFKPIQDYLQELNVPCTGKERFNSFTYYKENLKGST